MGFRDMCPALHNLGVRDLQCQSRIKKEKVARAARAGRDIAEKRPTGHRFSVFGAGVTGY